MFVSECLQLNEKGHLTIGGCDTVELAAQYGTPVYVMDENQIRANCRSFVQSIREHYDGNGRVLYASKAFCCKEICRIAAQEELGLDVASGGELYTALQAGFPAGRIYFHGNNKMDYELKAALEAGVGRFVVDNLDELAQLEALAAACGKTADIIFRIKPGIDAHTHSFIRTGQIDSKFGLALETGEAYEAVRKAAGMPHIRLRGLHCHIGSQIFDISPFELAADVMMTFYARIRDELHVELDELNLGGGFGIQYTQRDKAAAYESYMTRVSAVVKEKAAEYSLRVPFILIEPGRSIVGAAGITLYTVGSVKEIPNVRTYVSVDGGMVDNPRYLIYKAEYEILCANRAGEERDFCVTVAGRCCESGDLIQENTMIQHVSHGDILAVLSTGAYNYSMASNYNRIPRPPVVMVKDGLPRMIVRRETYEDIVKNDL